MKYNKINRRMFLQGTGSLLSIPLLESLVPTNLAHALDTPPVRYIQMLSPYGVSPVGLYGNGSEGISHFVKNNPAALQTISQYVRKVDLGLLPGNQIGYVIGPELAAMRSKISILRGLDLLHDDPTNRGLNHNRCAPTCASITSASDFSTPKSDQESLDVIMSKSAKIYPANFPADRRLINLGPPGRDDYKSYEDYSCSYKRTANGLERVPIMRSTTALKDLFTTQQQGEPTGISSKLVDVMNSVFADYSSVRQSASISSSDKTRLDNYMDLLSDIKNGLDNQNAVATCTTPTLAADSTAEEQFRNQARILAAAMACDSTRVASIAMHFNIPTISNAHSQHHKLKNDSSSAEWADTLAFFNNKKVFSQRMAYLMSAFDGITESDGNTMLHNSIMYWGMEYGSVWWWGQHSREDFPAIIAGGGGGKLRHGNYIDYRKYPDASKIDSLNSAGANGISCTLRGIPLNNLMVTFMNCMGLDYTDYETVAGKGYGYYPAQKENIIGSGGANLGLPVIPNEDYWFSTTGRRSAVPYLYTG